METITNPLMQGLLTNLQSHAQLTAAGIPSAQSSNIVFNRLRTEDARHNQFMASSLSHCCSAIILFDFDMPFCASCGEFCNAMPNESV